MGPVRQDGRDGVQAFCLLDPPFDVERDIANMNLELAFSDLLILERRLSRLEESLKAAKQAERAGIIREQEAIARIKADLERDIPVREMTLTEEEDRFVLKLDPCNTGGRMRREGLDNPPINLGKVKKPVPESWDRTGISYYCAHCGLHSLMGVEKGAPHPTWIYRCPENPKDPCYQYCYKRTEDVPEAYFKELGLKKPKR